ncbi:hypothetical protein CRG98_012398 [Punica granatum]|uniref:Uncharacterized protein n=1 Tax=Punica granatum TaxID=22663 RepID=A0A2I0KF96_PUNGR|nr:hypothetical protein CRG98_012398 [Punica granatum]
MTRSTRDLGGRGPHGSVAPRGARGHLPCKGAEGSLGSSEAMDFSSRDVGGFSGYISELDIE